MVWLSSNFQQNHMLGSHPQANKSPTRQIEYEISPWVSWSESECPNCSATCGESKSCYNHNIKKVIICDYKKNPGANLLETH